MSEVPQPGDDCGVQVAGSGDLAVLSVSLGLNAGAGDDNRVYVFERLGHTWSRYGILHIDDVSDPERFGADVAISSTTVLVGAPGSGSIAGAAYVFIRAATDWVLEATLRPDSSAPGDLFGKSVALEGDTALVGSPGTASVHSFARSGGEWRHEGVLNVTDVVAEDHFGHSVALEGEVAVVGAPYKLDRRGAAFFFRRRAASDWTLHASFQHPGVTNDQFGSSVAASGRTVFVGALGQEAEVGAVHIFEQEDIDQVDEDDVAGNASGNSVSMRDFDWQMRGTLPRPSSISTGDFFGTSVDLFGDDVALIGAPNHHGSGGTRSGVAYFYERVNGTWSVEATLSVETLGVEQRFGRTVALAGEVAIVGACRLTKEPFAAYVFDHDYCKASLCSVGLILKPTAEIPERCDGSSCSVEECCDVADQCSSNVCTSGFILKWNLPDYCWGTTCEVVECCIPTGSCVASDCRAGWRLQSLPEFHRCSGATCTLLECCEQLGDCSAWTCNVTEGYALKSPTPPFCGNLACVNDECCDLRATCSSYGCPPWWMKKLPSAQPVFCNDTSCTRDECCERFDVCTINDCGNTTLLRRPAPSCITRGCPEEECCDPLDVCSANTCPGGFSLKTQGDLPVLCASTVCIVEECCDALVPVCTLDLCLDNFQVRLETWPERCAAWPCQQEECCGAPVECSVANCDEGWVLRGNIICNTTACKRDECCDQAVAIANPSIVNEVVFFAALTLTVAMTGVLAFLCVKWYRMTHQIQKVVPVEPEPTTPERPNTETSWRKGRLK